MRFGGVAQSVKEFQKSQPSPNKIFRRLGEFRSVFMYLVSIEYSGDVEESERALKSRNMSLYRIKVP